MQSLFGAWELIELCDLRDGLPTERDYKIEGRLLYARPNLVFVGLGYYKTDGYTSNFYSGSFEVEAGSNTVYHHVAVSSDVKRNASVLEREFSLDSGILTLRGKNNVGDSVQLKWRPIN